MDVLLADAIPFDRETPANQALGGVEKALGGVEKALGGVEKALIGLAGAKRRRQPTGESAECEAPLR